MTNELRNKAGEIFWSDECANAVAAIEFALDDIEEHYDRLDFLSGWREGDVAPWPEFVRKVSQNQEPPR